MTRIARKGASPFVFIRVIRGHSDRIEPPIPPRPSFDAVLQEPQPQPEPTLLSPSSSSLIPPRFDPSRSFSPFLARRERQVIEAIKGIMVGMDLELRGYQVFLFGSRAVGNARERSDFDVGVLGAEPLPPSKFYRAQELLDDLDTLYRIDWVDLNRVSDDFRLQALKATEVLYG